MQNKAKNILDARFRANPNYEMVLYDRLPSEYQQTWQSLLKDPDFYGVLWPRETHAKQIKAVDQQTALLFFTLHQPGKIPTYVHNKLGERCNQIIAELVLDGVLEMVSDEQAEFISGPEAYKLIYQSTNFELGKGHIAQLSFEALRYAQELAFENSSVISSRLYFYNTIPVSPSWRRRLPDADTALSFLGIDNSGATQRTLSRYWRQAKPRQGGDGWILWYSRDAQIELISQASGPGYKLYISPLPEILPEIWQIILRVFADMQVSNFKVGKGIYGLLRPDKIVAYCKSFEELSLLANALLPEIKDYPAQGVPFTAGFGDTGILSWGMDPPDEVQVSNEINRESWRLWVTNRLAVALLAARAATTDFEPWQFALERMRLEGVNTEKWIPSQTIWQR